MWRLAEDLGIDLGTANIVVYARGRGIVLREPSVVAIDARTKSVKAVGEEARLMLGRTPGSIVAKRPLRDGVIADYSITRDMLAYLIGRACGKRGRIFKPTIVICIPSGATNVEKRAALDAARSAGARKAIPIEEPMAAAIGAGLPIDLPGGNMVVDVGGGTTDIAVISLGGIVISDSLRVGGNKLDEAIVRHVRRTYNLDVGEPTAENIKVEIGSAVPIDPEHELDVKGRDIVSGLPKVVSVSSVEVRDAMQEGIAGAAVVQTFARRHHEVRRYMHVLHNAYKAVIRMVFMQSIIQNHIIGWEGFLPWLKNQVVRVYFLRKVVLGELSYGSVFPIFSYMNRLAGPIQGLVGMVQAIRAQLVAAERILQTLDELPVVTEKRGAGPMPPVSGKVDFDNVSFSYEDGQPVLHDVSFTVEPGKRVGIVGSSGSGKSTIVNLLLRLYDPSEGSVRVDGTDLRDVKLDSYQHQVGLVLQETHLFNGTIRENILFGKIRATDEEVENAGRLAELHDFVMTLEEGYDTDLREGTRLSGGQKQRIGIARAIIGDPSILVLDEPTSSLDSATEERVYRTLNRVGEGRTTFIVSHRLSTVMEADEILVMADGRIVERGTHEALVERRGAYYDMYVLYFGLREGTNGGSR